MAPCRPECASGGHMTSDCSTCLSQAEAAGGCCEVETANCRADSECSANLDCVGACADSSCADQCITSTDFELVFSALACLYGMAGVDRGACGNVCPVYAAENGDAG